MAKLSKFQRHEYFARKILPKIPKMLTVEGKQCQILIERRSRDSIISIVKNGEEIVLASGKDLCEMGDKFLKVYAECQDFTARKAKESQLRNGTFPKKGYYSPNLQKGAKYQFKPGHKPVKLPF